MDRGAIGSHKSPTQLTTHTCTPLIETPWKRKQTVIVFIWFILLPILFFFFFLMMGAKRKTYKKFIGGIVTQPNWVHLPECPVRPVYWHGVAVKESIAFLARSNKDSRQLVLKRLELPGGFQGNVFKDRGRGRAARCMTSSWMFFWLVGGEVIRSQHHQPETFWFHGVYMFMDSLQLTSSTW